MSVCLSAVDGEHEASRRMKTEFFAQMDGISSSSGQAQSQRVMVLATTNCPWDLDAAILRRLEKRIYVPLPDQAAREEQFLLAFARMKGQLSLSLSLPHSTGAEEGDGREEEAAEKVFARLTEGFSCADIQILCREAAMAPMRRLLGDGGLDTGKIQELRSKGQLTVPEVSSSRKFREYDSHVCGQVLREDFLAAIEGAKTSVSAASIDRYDHWNKSFGST